MYQLDANNVTMIFILVNGPYMRQCNNLYIRTPEDGHVNVRNM